MLSTHVTTKTQLTGNFRLLINESFADDDLIKLFANMRELTTTASRISHGKDYVVKKSLRIHGVEYEVAIKVFTRQSWLKDLYDKKNLSKAERSYLAAEQLINAGIKTPLPIACLDHWENNRLLESYYLCLFEPAICFRDALFQVFNSSKDSADLMELLHLVAPEIRRLHDAGFMHGDLGNQNILLPKKSDGSWDRPSFIDLNRYKYFPNGVGNTERAKDLARPILPSNYLHFFLQIYAGHQVLPPALAAAHQKERARFTRHRNSRNWRHPIRYLKQRGQPRTSGYPANKNYWLWDEKTAQPMIALSKQEKNQERSVTDGLLLFFRTLKSLPAIWKHYRQLKTQDFSQPILLSQRIGIALNPKASYQKAELTLLKTLGNPPIFIRFYRHESPEQWHATIDLIHRLHEQGIQISVGLLQDREAVLDKNKWHNFLETIIPAIADYVFQLEITHAFNRAKWGTWRINEWRSLTEAAFRYQTRYPSIRLTGPACIDFEYASVVSALTEIQSMNSNYQYDALSHLLYVDRRGAPENKQGKFSTLEKVRLLKAIALSSQSTRDRVVISEVNWPLENTDIWSPIVCPYVTARWQSRPSGESEIDYAHYMLRYYMICLCSGHIDQVFWWQLSAKGYGLVDDHDNFRQRPAFIALRFLLSLLGEARFEQRLPSERKEDFYLAFSKAGHRYLMAWTTKDTLAFPQALITPQYQAWDYLGEPIQALTLSESPIYIKLD